jgi:hypothetical protein
MSSSSSSSTSDKLKKKKKEEEDNEISKKEEKKPSKKTSMEKGLVKSKGNYSEISLEMPKNHEIPWNPDNLDFLLELVYSAIYTQSPAYQYCPIQLDQEGTVSESQWKRGKSWDWKQIFRAKFSLIEERNGKIIFKRRRVSTYPATVKIGFYKEKDAPKNMSSSPNVDMRTTYLLNELVSTQKLRWIFLSMAQLDLDLDQLRQFPDVYSHVEPIATKHKSSKVYVQVMEHYARHTSLMFWLQTQQLEDREWKSLLFHLLLTLAKLQEEYPLFRHNRYNPESFEVYVVDKGRVDSALLDNMLFEVEDPGFEIRLSDFDHSTGVDQIKNEDIEDGMRAVDPLHDQRTMASWLLKHVSSLTSNTLNFIKEIRASKLIPRELLLTNRYFEEIRKPKIKSP